MNSSEYFQNSRVEQLAEALYQAHKQAHTISPLTQRFKDLDLDEAYRISLAFLNKRMDRDNERLIGKKIGVTSPAVQNMLGVHQPDFGFLTDNMLLAEGAKVQLSKRLIQPRAEGEIAFMLAKDLNGPGVTEMDVLEATEYITPCFEIVDSRIDNWAIKIQDTVADNASCGVFNLGDTKADPREFNLANLAMKVYKNDQLISQGLGSAVQGNPLTAVAWLANTLGRFGVSLDAGDIILSGSLVPLEPVIAGDKFELEIEGLGGASISFN